MTWGIIQITQGVNTCVNRIMNKNQIVISIEAKNSFNKIQLHFMKMDPNLTKLKLRGNFLNLRKDVYEKCTANVILNVERMNAYSLKISNNLRLGEDT
jgi:hypothetical protein